VIKISKISEEFNNFSWLWAWITSVHPGYSQNRKYINFSHTFGQSLHQNLKSTVMLVCMDHGWIIISTVAPMLNINSYTKSQTSMTTWIWMSH